MATKKKSAKKAKTTRKVIDWEAIKEEFEADQISVAEIARKYSTTHQAIFQRAKRKGWKRDLAKKVRKRVVQKLVADVADRNATEEEITEAAAERGVQIIKLHRQDIAKMKEVEQKLLAELDDKPTKLWIGQYQGQVVKEEVGIAVTERASALQALAQVQHKRIALERQAYNLDETGDGETIEDKLKRIVDNG